MRATAFCKDFFEHSVISLRTSVIKTTTLLGYLVQYSRFFCLLGEIQHCWWEAVLSGNRCEAVTWDAGMSFLCCLSLVHSCSLPPVVVSELLLERLSSPPHHRNIKPFCVSKHFRLPITQSWKSENGPINLADHYLGLLLFAGVMVNTPRRW